MAGKESVIQRVAGDTGATDPGSLRGRKLLVVAVAWPAETFIMRRLEGLASTGMEVHLCVVRRPGQRMPNMPGLRLVRLTAWHGPWPLRLGSFALRFSTLLFVHPRALFRLLGRVRVQMKNAGRSAADAFREVYRLLPFVGLRPDILHFEWNSMAIEYWPLFDLFHCPTVVSCRGSQIHVAPHNSLRKAIRDELRRTFDGANAVHCVSKAIARDAENYGLTPQKTHVIRPAVNVAQYAPPASGRGTDGECVEIVCVGNLGWVKGFEDALVAFHRLVEEGPPARLTIIGSGPDLQRLQFTVLDLGLENQVSFAGRLPPAQVLAVLQRSDIFLLSSLSEGISNAALEAMACGLPVVTTDCGGMSEVISDGVEGFVVPVRDTEAMATALRRLAEDAPFRREMGAAARRRAVDELDLSRQVGEFVYLYQGLLATARSD